MDPADRIQPDASVTQLKPRTAGAGLAAVPAAASAAQTGTRAPDAVLPLSRRSLPEEGAGGGCPPGLHEEADPVPPPQPPRGERRAAGTNGAAEGTSGIAVFGENKSVVRCRSKL
jgi:hypothetical protein